MVKIPGSIGKPASKGRLVAYPIDVDLGVCIVSQELRANQRTRGTGSYHYDFVGG
jgi:hypothetical protein